MMPFGAVYCEAGSVFVVVSVGFFCDQVDFDDSGCLYNFMLYVRMGINPSVTLHQVVKDQNI